MQNFKFKQNNVKKKPPPRPPPPNFSKYKSKSTYDLNKQDDNLIQWSPQNSPKVEKKHTFGGSVSSSFSSSTSSLASSKRSFEFEVSSSTPSTWYTQVSNTSVPAPTIIRPQPIKKHSKIDNEVTSLPMPTVPPPSPPKDAVPVEIPYGVALYNFDGTAPGDLPLQVNDIVVLLRRINADWLYGKVLDKEGMFPASFIDIQVPLKSDEFYVKAVYQFDPQESGDLALRPGQIVKVIKMVSSEWMFGESEGKCGQFPSNFVNRIHMLSS